MPIAQLGGQGQEICRRMGEDWCKSITVFKIEVLNVASRVERGNRSSSIGCAAMPALLRLTARGVED